jgi:hypothetical protein
VTGAALAHLRTVWEIAFPLTFRPTRSWAGGTMDKHCPYCGISVAGDLRCPLCDTRLVSANVNVRRALLWAFVVEEYLLVMVVMMRLT